MKRLFFFIALIIVSCVLAAIFTSKLVAAESSSKCDLGQTDGGLKACKAVTYLVRFAVHPVGDVDWVIENAKAAVEQARLAGEPHTALVQMQLPWLIAKALAADAMRHVDAIEQSGIVPSGFLDETAQTITKARKAGADVSDLEQRFKKELEDLYQISDPPKKLELGK